MMNSSNGLERVEAQIRWMRLARNAIKALEYMPPRQNVLIKDFNDVRVMKRHELKEFIRSKQNKRACKKIKSMRYTPMDAYLASKVVYARNRLSIM